MHLSILSPNYRYLRDKGASFTFGLSRVEKQYSIISFAEVSCFCFSISKKDKRHKFS